MTVVISGASGFIGRHAIAAFLAQGREVIALTRDARRLQPLPRLRVVETDYASIDVPPDATVVHLAAVRNAPGARGHDETNVRLASAVARASTRVRKFVHVSTALALGSSATPLDETAPFAETRDTYVRSRIEAVRAVAAVAELPVVTLLPTIVFGPDHPVAPNRITSHMRRLLRRPYRVAVGGATAPRNLVFIEDVVRAIVAAENEPGGSRRVVAGEDLSQDAFERHVYAAAGRTPAPRIVIPRVLAMTGAHAADVLLRTEQGWVSRLETLFQPWCFRSSFPSTFIGEAIARTVRSL